MRSRRIWLASSLAPLSTPVVVYGVFLLGSLLQLQTWGGPAAASAVAAVATIIGYILTIVVGMPMHAFLQKRHWDRLRHYGVAGCALGALFLGTLSAYMVDRAMAQRRLTSEDVHIVVFWVVLGAACGGATATAAWYVAGRQPNPVV